MRFESVNSIMREYTLKCDHCQEDFSCTARKWQQARYDKKRKNLNHYCSKQCKYKGKSISEKQQVSCQNCNKDFFKHHNQIKSSPNHFCSRSCAATFNNQNKTHGTRRSKLEKYLEAKLVEFYPELEFHFNRKDAINSELDIYIPSLRLAFELNGIFHYEPIYGEDKLKSIQNNDGRKFQACVEKGIELCIIDTSALSYFKEKNAEKYLNIINYLIMKVVATVGFEPTL